MVAICFKIDYSRFSYKRERQEGIILQCIACRHAYEQIEYKVGS
jgi:hypothetical protein